MTTFLTELWRCSLVCLAGGGSVFGLALALAWCQGEVWQ